MTRFLRRNPTTCAWILTLSFVYGGISPSAHGETDSEVSETLAPLAFLVGKWEGPGHGQWGKFKQVVEVKPTLDGRVLEISIENHSDDVFSIRGFATVDVHGRVMAAFYDEMGIAMHCTGLPDQEQDKPAIVFECLDTVEQKVIVVRRIWRMTSDDTLEYVLDFNDLDKKEVLNSVTLKKQ